MNIITVSITMLSTTQTLMCLPTSQHSLLHTQILSILSPVSSWKPSQLLYTRTASLLGGDIIVTITKSNIRYLYFLFLWVPQHSIHSLMAIFLFFVSSDKYSTKSPFPLSLSFKTNPTLKCPLPSRAKSPTLMYFSPDLDASSWPSVVFPTPGVPVRQATEKHCSWYSYIRHKEPICS